MVDYHADYVGVHQSMYERIASGELKGWSTPEIAEETFQNILQGIKHSDCPTEGKLLELGCGDGCLTVLLGAKTKFEVFGIDIVPQAISLAKFRANETPCKVEFRIGDVLSLPWKKNYFDVLVDGSCFHCIVLDDRKIFLSEAFRVLREGGGLFITTLIGDPPSCLPGVFDPENRCLIRDGVAGRHFGTRNGVLAEIQSAGLDIVQDTIRHATDIESSDELFALAIKPNPSLC